MWQLRPFFALALLWFALLLQSMQVPAGGIGDNDSRISYVRQPRGNLSTEAPPGSLLANASASDIVAARQVVKDAMARMRKLNKARVENPAGMNYEFAPTMAPRGAFRTKKIRGDAGSGPSTGNPPSPLLKITAEIARAAVLLAEVEAVNRSAPLQKRGGTFWMETMTHNHVNTMPCGNDASYKTRQRLSREAISDQNRCGGECNGATTKNAIVYLPAGTYLVSSSIALYFGTQLIGDATSRPTILASSSFVGLGVLSTDVYVPNGGTGSDDNALEWYFNTARFYSQIRNVIIDITATDPTAYVCGIHYQAAQAASIENVELKATTGTTQQGISSENGSGGVMSDVTFSGGNFGFYGGNQQFSASNLVFNGCSTAVQLHWDWGWVWQGIKITGCTRGFVLTESDSTAVVGSIAVFDSIISTSGAAIVLTKPTSAVDSGSTGLVLDNVNLGGSVVDQDGNTLKAGGYIKNWVIGTVYDSSGTRSWTGGEEKDYTREKSLTGASVSGLQVAPYFWQSRNQYASLGSSSFVHLKADGGAAGDGSSDDTARVQNFFNKYGDGSKIMYIDSGTYLLTSTVTIPKNAQIVGECWAQFAASGAYFSDPTDPKVMLQVGNPGEKGTFSMQDLILTTRGGTAGAILMQWNVQAATQGSAVLWDVHARVGGATGTELTQTQCPGTPGSVNPDSCKAASLLLHVAPEASEYFYNMWLWVADHNIDDPEPPSGPHQLPGVSVYGARGALIESQQATWLYGTAAEHSAFYQYNFNNAENIFTLMLQTESAYYQPSPAPPQPFQSAVGKLPGDPSYTCTRTPTDAYDGCDASWAVIINGSANIDVASGGTYSWFSSLSKACVLQHTCQQALWKIGRNYDGVRLNNVVTVGVKTSVDSQGIGFNASADLQTSVGAAFSQFTLFDVPSSGAPPTPSGAACQEGDHPYADVGMREGTFFNSAYYDYSLIPSSNTYYVTIVNLTPYAFHLTSSHSYQVSFNPADVPSGKALQIKVEYGDGTQVDDNGEMYYTIAGTSKTFQVRTTTHIPGELPYRTVFDLTGMGYGQREYGDPYQTSGVTLVIAGSEAYGYAVNSLTFQPQNWMHGIYDVIKDRQLRHVVMPGSHDSSMYTISDASSGFEPVFAGTKTNTQTQSLGMFDQLQVGARHFDMRIVSILNGVGGYWGAHLVDEKPNVLVGATGAKYPGEVIVWKMRYLVEVGGQDGRFWDAAQAHAFYEYLTNITNRCTGLSDLDTDFGQQPIKNFLNTNNGAGCVLLLNSGDMQNGVAEEDLPKGIYASWRMGIDDYWAEQRDPADKAAVETANLQTVTRDNGRNDTYLIMQWQCTPDPYGDGEWGLEEYAVWGSNPSLYWAGVNAMSPTHFPTVILQDYIGQIDMSILGEDSTDGYLTYPGGLGAEIQTLCIGLNLYMVSQNCKVSPLRNPLYDAAVDATVARRDSAEHFLPGPGGNGTHVSPPPTSFKGAIWANGTVDHAPPPTLHIGRPALLKAGTRFSNGTVLSHDVPNPDYNNVQGPEAGS